jgi:hypothetical protein
VLEDKNKEEAPAAVDETMQAAPAVVEKEASPEDAGADDDESSEMEDELVEEEAPPEDAGADGDESSEVEDEPVEPFVDEAAAAAMRSEEGIREKPETTVRSRGFSFVSKLPRPPKMKGPGFTSTIISGVGARLRSKVKATKKKRKFG